MSKDFGINETLLSRLAPQEEVKTPKIEHSFQDLALEICDYFSKGEKDTLIFSLFYKHPERKIRDAFTALKKSKVKTISYFLGIIKNTS